MFTWSASGQPGTLKAYEDQGARYGMAAPAAEKLRKHFPYEYCWNCGQPGHHEGTLLWQCDACQVQWRAYEDQPGSLDYALWMARSTNCVDFAPRKDRPKGSRFTDPAIPSTP